MTNAQRDKAIRTLEAILTDTRAEVQQLQARVEQLEDLLVPVGADRVQDSLDDVLGSARKVQTGGEA